MKRIFKAILGMIACAVCVWPAGVLADNHYPSTGLRIIVPYGASSGPDSVARRIGQRLSEQMGIPVVIENREGAGGSIAARAVATAPPNGSTIGVIASPGFFSVPLMQKQAVYDPIAQFTAIARVADSPLLLVASPKATFTDFESLRAQARQQPGKLTFAATGVGSATHLSMEALKLATKLDIRFVPYKSTGQQATDLLGGQIDLNVTSLGGSLPQARAQQVRAIAVGSLRRSPGLPDVPTFAEVSGKRDLEAVVWYGFVGPKNMPEPLVRRLSAEIQKAMASAPVAALFDANGLLPSYEAPNEFAQTMARSAAEAEQLVKLLRLGPQE